MAGGHTGIGEIQSANNIFTGKGVTGNIRIGGATDWDVQAVVTTGISLGFGACDPVAKIPHHDTNVRQRCAVGVFDSTADGTACRSRGYHVIDLFIGLGLGFQAIGKGRRGA